MKRKLPEIKLWNVTKEIKVTEKKKTPHEGLGFIRTRYQEILIS